MNAKSKALTKKMRIKEPITITIIRHGETKLNKEKKIRGWSDVPLSEDAKPAIERTARELKDKLDIIVTSDLKRAVETAKIISKKTGTPIVETSKSYRPWDVGDHTGEPQDEVYKYMAYYARHAPAQGFKNGESFNTFKRRFLHGIEGLKKEYPGESIGIVTHHRGDRIFAAWHAKDFPPDLSVDIDIFLKGGVDPGEACRPVEY